MNAHFLSQYGVVATPGSSQAADLVVDAIGDPWSEAFSSPHDFLKKWWNLLAASNSNSNLRGGIFEYLLATVFIREGLLPFYVQAQVEFVPNVRFDFLFWTLEKGPIVISAKTSLRERYKQADLEAMAISSVHRRSETHLVTLDAAEAARVSTKISNGDVQFLKSVAVADSLEFDELVSKIRELTLVSAPVIPTLRSGREVVNLRIANLEIEIDK
jgi:hypothetical protein